MKVSIIIAVYNGYETIDKCLNSIFEQDYPDKELIIFDAGSTDGTVDLLKQYDSKIDFWVSEPDSGIYNAWNKGIEKASGDWLCFIGCDDYYAERNALSKMMQLAIEDESVDYITSRGAKVSASGDYKSAFGIARDWRKNCKKMTLCHPGSLYKKILFERLGKFDENYQICADYDFDQRMGPSLKVAHINEVLICLGDEGVSRDQKLKMLKETFIIQKQYSGMTSAIFNYMAQLSEHFVFRFLTSIGLQKPVKSFLVKYGLLNR